MSEESVFKLRIDLVVALSLLLAAKAGRPARLNSDVCFYLGDRYFRLSEHYRRSRKFKKAERLRAKAEFYFEGSGPWRDPPRAAAMAMPVPKRPTFIEAIGWRMRKDPPDDAA